jgi:hypothetical protein
MVFFMHMKKIMFAAPSALDNKAVTRRADSQAAVHPGALSSTPSNPVEPETIRLPKPGLLCPHSGLTRSYLNELTLPCAANNWKPPVRSIVLRKRGAQRGIRLVVWSSLKSYLYAQDPSDHK